MNKVTVSHHEAAPGTITSYVTGFIMSVSLTLAAYFIVVEQVWTGWTAVLAITGLAVLQLLVQLLFFLHLGRESKPRWNLQVFLFMAMVIVIVVFGSLWIMNNLSYHHGHSAPDKTIEEFIIKDEGYQPKP